MPQQPRRARPVAYASAVQAAPCARQAAASAAVPNCRGAPRVPPDIQNVALKRSKTIKRVLPSDPRTPDAGTVRSARYNLRRLDTPKSPGGTPKRAKASPGQGAGLTVRRVRRICRVAFTPDAPRTKRQPPLSLPFPLHRCSDRPPVCPSIAGAVRLPLHCCPRWPETPGHVSIAPAVAPQPMMTRALRKKFQAAAPVSPSPRSSPMAGMTSPLWSPRSPAGLRV